jgi:leucyl-tRNA synthetase
LESRFVLQFEANATMKEMREKYPNFFGRMAYPYMNESIHPGHAFSLTKIELLTRYERMQVRRYEYPNNVRD